MESRRRLAADLARILNDEAHELAENGCDIIQFDEPCFNIYLDAVEEWGIATLEAAAKGVGQNRGPTSATATAFPRCWPGRQRIRIGTTTSALSPSSVRARSI